MPFLPLRYEVVYDQEQQENTRRHQQRVGDEHQAESYDGEKDKFFPINFHFHAAKIQIFAKKRKLQAKNNRFYIRISQKNSSFAVFKDAACI